MSILWELPIRRIILNVYIGISLKIIGTTGRELPIDFQINDN